MKLVKEIRYKDSHRVWWQLRIYQSSTTKTTRYVKSGIELKDRVWDYSLERENFSEATNEEFVEVFSGSIRGQYDQVPSVRDCMLDWQLRVNSIAMGFCVQEQHEHQGVMLRHSEDYEAKEKQQRLAPE